jgi:hypothetical protein
MGSSVKCGADTGPKCPACNWRMSVIRRTPHPVYGIGYELQTFECRECDLEIMRSADQHGLPHASDAP